MKIKYNSEIISGGVFSVAALILWLLIPSQVQTMEKSVINAQTFPRAAIGGLLIFSIALLIQGLFFAPKKELMITSEKMPKGNAFRRLCSFLAGLLPAHWSFGVCHHNSTARHRCINILRCA